MTLAEISSKLRGEVTVELVDNAEGYASGAYVVIHGRSHDGILWTIYADSPSVYVAGEQVVAS